MAQQFYSQEYTKRIKDMYEHKHLSMSVHSSIIHNVQKVETIQMSINWWMN